MVDILAFGAHPDDVEFACGGILAKMAAQGKTIAIVDLTLGDKGSNGTAGIRKEEGIAAAKIIGAHRSYLDFKDCEVMDDYASRLKLAAAIREYKPFLVLAPLWYGQETHPDHLACGQLTRHACRYARFKSLLPEVAPHRVKGLLHYLFPSQGNPDFLVDVSDHLETWKALVACHRSQMETRDYMDWNLRSAAHFGVLAGTAYAQGLVQGNPTVVEDIMTIGQGTIELG